MTMTYSWFRVYNGTINDTKWPRIARDSKQSVGAVVSVWMALLECASMSDDRGSVDDFSPEDIDVLYGYDDGTTDSIFQAMKARGLITSDNCLEAWAKRQSPESGDAGKPRASTERVRRFRAKRSSKSDETLHETDETDETPYKRREEKKREDNNIKHTPLTPQGETQGVGEGPAEDCSDVPMAERRPVNTGLPSRGANASWWREFASLWDIWPNKQGKDAAWAVYYDLRRRKIDMPPLYVLRDKASAMIAQDRKFLAGYAPELKTWLREHRWNDEPCPPRDVAVPSRGRTSREQQMATDVERAAEAARRFEDFFEMAADEPAAEGVFA